MILETPRLRILLPLDSDIESIISFYKENQEFLKEWEPARPEYFHHETYWKEIVKRNLKEFDEKDRAKFIIKDKETKNIIGMINFSRQRDISSKSLQVGYKLGQDYEGKGMMTEALKKTAQFMFDDFELDRIYARVLPRNSRSLILLKKMGFINEKRIVKIQIAGKDQEHYSYFINREQGERYEC